MKLTVETTINDRQKVTMEFDGKMNQCLAGANAVLAYDGICHLCNGANIVLQQKKIKGYEFIEFVCLDCGARAQWGQYKDGVGYFLKDWAKYEGKKQDGEQKQSEEEFEDDSIPF